MNPRKAKYRFDICQMTAECEANYRRLQRLLPDVAWMSAQVMARKIPLPIAMASPLRRLSLSASWSTKTSLNVSFSLQQQSRFTSSLIITVDLALGEVASYLSPPTVMQVQMYHDIKLAEVISIAGRRASLASYDYPNDKMFLPDEKAQQNKLLAEWLERCLSQGVESEGESKSAVDAMLVAAAACAADSPKEKITVISAKGAR